MDRLALPDASVDVVTAGYGVRNTPDARRAVREMARVLRPGGVVVTLDFYRPQFAPWRRLLLAYLAGAGNLVGWWWHREPVVYGYIARSIDHFMSWQAFSRLLRDEGMAPVAVRRFLGGGIAIHVARSG
jgi:demethylmenaquinone methyltransferase/2-methoxy-6-polyprenyl-1,4-benzoquinol methylase